MKVLLVNSEEYFEESCVAFCATHGRPPTKPELCTQSVLVGHPSSSVLVLIPAFNRLFRHFVKTTYRAMAAVCCPRCVLVGLCVVLCAMACALYIRTKQTSGSFRVSHYDGGGADKTFSDNLISTAHSEVSTLPETSKMNILEHRGVDAESKRCQQLRHWQNSWGELLRQAVSGSSLRA